MSRKYPDGWAKYAVKEGFSLYKKRKRKKKRLVKNIQDNTEFVHKKSADKKTKRDYGIQIGSRVTHISFGRGTVRGRSKDLLIVLFEDGRERRIGEAYAIEKGLMSII